MRACVDAAQPRVVPRLTDGDASRGVYNQELADEVGAVVAEGVGYRVGA